MSSDSVVSFDYLSLPKWPELRVTGKPVTVEQAAEIIIRTDAFLTWGGGNDRVFNRNLFASIGYPNIFENDSWGARFDELDEIRRKVAWVGGQYLCNDRISSSYIFGPHGWCNWDGRIGCAGYNVGKWPSVSEITDEWVEIARAFPFLDLSAQLMSGGESEDDISPVVEFRIKNGLAIPYLPAQTLHVPSNVFARNHFLPIDVLGGERGCTVDQFREAFERTVKRLGTS